MRDIAEFSDKPFPRCTECNGTGYYHPWGTDGYDPTPVRKSYVVGCSCVPRNEARSLLNTIETIKGINKRLHKKMDQCVSEMTLNNAKIEEYEAMLEELLSE